MAKLYNNISIIPLASASADQFVNPKTRLGKTILASKPMFDDAQKYSETKTHQAAIREATT